MTASILVGTAGWTDASLAGPQRFYPRGCTSAEDRLRYYASRFAFVEVDATYYAMPSESNVRKWIDRTPAHFVFNVKAFRALTGHATPVDALPRDLVRQLSPPQTPALNATRLPLDVREALWQRFATALRPLADAGKLGAVHFQFPPWFRAGRQSLDYLDEVRERMAGYTVAIEFRHASWFEPGTRAATLAWERERDLVNVVVDAPQGVGSSVPAVWEATSAALAIVRLHGRNVAGWRAKGPDALAERFDYDYSDTQLAELAERVRTLAHEVRRVQVVFNNMTAGQGMRNALAFQSQLGGDRI